MSNYTAVVDPATYETLRASRSARYAYEQPLLDSSMTALTDVQEDYAELRERCKPLAESTKQSAEINEEDHGKAILVFTVVTIVFLPLSFVTSYLGMNTTDIRNMGSTQTLFWEIAVPRHRHHAAHHPHVGVQRRRAARRLARMHALDAAPAAQPPREISRCGCGRGQCPLQLRRRALRGPAAPCARRSEGLSLDARLWQRHCRRGRVREARCALPPVAHALARAWPDLGHARVGAAPRVCLGVGARAGHVGQCSSAAAAAAGIDGRTTTTITCYAIAAAASGSKPISR